MNVLIPMTSNGLFVNTDKEVMIDSRYIAETFDKEHFTVIRDIKDLISKLDNLEEETGAYKFVCTSYEHDTGVNILTKWTEKGKNFIVKLLGAEKDLKV